MNTPSSLLANPTLSDVSLQLESLRGGVAPAQGAEGETRLRELKKATQEFEAVFIGCMLKVMRSTVEPADDEEGNALGKDVYLSMFDQEIALQMARSSSLGIREMMYRQLEQTVKETKTLGGGSRLKKCHSACVERATERWTSGARTARNAGSPP
jgi:flagellar protein FlgJ